jgi:toxin CptA
MDLSLTLNPGASRALAWLFGIGHAAAFAAAWIALPRAWAALLLGAALSVSLWRNLRLHCWRTAPDAVTACTLEPDWRARLLLARGESVSGRLMPSTFGSPLLAVLNVRTDRSRWRRSVVLAWDSLPADEFRRLRVWLRWRAPDSERP